MGPIRIVDDGQPEGRFSPSDCFDLNNGSYTADPGNFAFCVSATTTNGVYAFTVLVQYVGELSGDMIRYPDGCTTLRLNRRLTVHLSAEDANGNRSTPASLT